jgi:aspartate-semialdehyde dehydrogenase
MRWRPCKTGENPAAGVLHYQAVSRQGAAGLQELQEQVRAWAEGREMKSAVYPVQIAFNVIAQIGSPKDDEPGYTSEEVKLKRETHKILGDDSIRVVSTCVRVPVFNGHSEALHVEFERPISADEARAILARSPGVRLADDLSKSLFPTPIACS